MEQKLDVGEHGLVIRDAESTSQRQHEFGDQDELDVSDEFDVESECDLDRHRELLSHLASGLVWGGNFIQIPFTQKDIGMKFSTYKENADRKEYVLSQYKKNLGDDSFYVPLVIIILTVILHWSSEVASDQDIRELVEEFLEDEMFFTVVNSLFAHEDEELFISLLVLKQLYEKIIYDNSLASKVIEILEQNEVIKGWYLKKGIQDKGVVSLVVNYDHDGIIMNELNFNLI